MSLDRMIGVKRSRCINTWFTPANSSSYVASVCPPIAEIPQPSESPVADSPNMDFNPLGNINGIERDPGKRLSIWKYPLNERDSIQKAYIFLGPNQPKLIKEEYPLTLDPDGKQQRRFNAGWFIHHPWLEYSMELNKSIRLLANQGHAFRGHDESNKSLNAGNFKQVIKSFARMSVEVDRVVLDNAPRNAKYTTPTIQKEILNIIGNKVRKKIIEKMGDSKFCILVDEAVDVAGKEQMSIILRFVDCHGLVRERFFKIVSVPNTNSLTLKNEISRVLGMFNLQVKNMWGQGYDGASNVSGVWNGIQALFREECPFAYCVHCFAHRLQLALNTSAKDVVDVWAFFSTLNVVIIFLDKSAKRKFDLKLARAEEVADLVAIGDLDTGKGANQACTLQQAGATRWGSHLRSINSLIKLYGVS